MNPLERVWIVATRNRGKAAEFRAAFSPLGVEVRDLNALQGVPEVEETGATFAANAELKARAVAAHLGLPVLADDSGLCVDALDGAPGVYSARYAGEGATDADNNAKLLRELAARSAQSAAHAQPVPPSVADAQTIQSAVPAVAEHHPAMPPVYSSARFVCALALVWPDTGKLLTAEGTVEGWILQDARGTGGFGYDPLFWLPALGKSMAELDESDKNAISHRGAALKNLLSRIKQLK